MSTKTVHYDRLLGNPNVKEFDYYLGFEILSWKQGNLYYARPQGWKGPYLSAKTPPLLRTRIWRWWHQVS